MPGEGLPQNQHLAGQADADRCRGGAGPAHRAEAGGSVAQEHLEAAAGAGASIDNEVDEQGVLRVDGRIPDDGRPGILEKTKFVVVGKIPQPADLSDADEIATGLKIGALYKDLEDQARDRGVRVIGLEDFLRYIGYERLEGKTARPRHDRAGGR